MSSGGDESDRLRQPTPPALWRAVAAALLVPVLLGTLALWNAGEHRALEASRTQSRTSYERRLLIFELVAALERAETAQRGFVLTGSADFLAPYGPAKAEAAASLRRLSAYQRATPRQQAALARVRSLLRAKFVEMDEVLRQRRVNGVRSAAARVSDGEGRRLMEQLRRETAVLRQDEEQVSDARVREAQEHVQRTQRTVQVIVVLATALVLLVMLSLWRQRRRRFLADLAAYGSAERNRAVLDSTIDPIIILNPSGSVESINAAASRLLGYRSDELARRDISAVVALPSVADAPFPQRIGLSDGRIATPYRSDVRVQHRNGQVVTVDVALGVMDLPDGMHIVASLRDVSERKRAEKLKDELISTISHELRTPLTSVVGALGLLRAGSGGELPETAARLIGIAESNARRLIRLINDMLDIDRMQSGQLHIERVSLNLGDVVRRACDDMRGLGQDQGVTVLCEVPETDLLVTGDAERLMQVVGNLASNAIRVSPPGGSVTVAVTAGGGMAQVSVDDDGPGVPPEFRDRIFRRFERAGEEQGPGTGLGLAISREIVQRHDGRIWFEDRPGTGTRFAFTLDLERNASGSTAPVGDRRCVLVCEDDPDNATLLARAVEELGFAADIVGTAREARQALARSNYVALLLDLHLPDENGLILARSLRNEDGSPTLPIVIVSGAERGAGDAVVPIDLVDWISKPVEPSRLERAIRAAIARSGVARPTILHLDDDRDVLDITSELLGREARLLKAGDLATARALLDRETPDVAILDVHLADGTGLDLLPDLTDRDGVAIPTIIYSAFDVGPHVAAQVDAVLVKSRRSLPDLRATIDRILRDGKG